VWWLASPPSSVCCVGPGVAGACNSCWTIGYSPTTIFTVAGPNYQGLWWNAPAGSQPGWGLAIDHQGDTLFAAWFTYGSTGAGQWLVMPNAARASDSTYSGDIYRTTGPAFNSRPWDPSAVASTKVGSGTLTFSSDRNGTFAYTVDGQSGGNTITRELFSSPVASCTAVP